LRARPGCGIRSPAGSTLRATGFRRARHGTRCRPRSPTGEAERLAAAGVRAAVRAGRARLSFHLYTTEGDVDRALEALSSE